MRNLSALLIVFFSWTITLSAQNLLTNGNFESGNLNDWNPTNSAISNTELAEGGQYCAKVRVSSKTGWIYQQKELVAGKTYRYSGYVKIGEVDKQYFFNIKCRNDYYISYNTLIFKKEYTDWAYVSKTFKVKETDTHKLAIYVPQKGTIYADSLVLEEIDPTGMSSEALIVQSEYGVVNNTTNVIADIPMVDIPFTKFLEGLQLSEKARVELFTLNEGTVADWRTIASEEYRIKVFAEDGSFRFYTLKFNDNVLLAAYKGDLDNKDFSISNVSSAITVTEFIESLRKTTSSTLRVEYVASNSEVAVGKKVTSAMQVRINSANNPDKIYSISTRNLYSGSDLLSLSQGVISTQAKLITQLPNKTMAFYLKETATCSPGATIRVVNADDSDVADDSLVSDDMKVLVTSETGRVTAYTISTISSNEAYGLYLNNKPLEVETLADNVISLNGYAKLHVSGSVNPLKDTKVYVNSPDAWIYFHHIRPSVVAEYLLDDIYINGVPCSYNYLIKNVRIKQYGRGTVIVPHNDEYEPLTVYAEAAYQGASIKMKPYTFYRTSELGALNDNVGSFRLKHGYMATLAENQDGTGFSKVFVASDSDLDISLMEPGLKDAVSFIRVFPWNWPSKKGFCGSQPYADAVDATWRYDWGMNVKHTLDVEFVPEKWGGGYAGEYGEWRDVTHMLAFNEPSHTEQSNLTVAQAIEYWPSLMKSGLRLSSPAIADNGKQWLWEFWDEIERLNYRVDYVVCHWYKGGRTAQQYYNYLKEIHDRTGRPIWVKEWNNGATWTNEAPPHSYEEQAKDIGLFLNMLDTTSWIERHSLYEWVGEWRQMINDYSTFELTPAGEIYKDNNAPVFYNSEAIYDHRESATQYPVLSFLNPENETEFNRGEEISVEVNASDTDGTISNVQLYLNGVFIGLDDTAPYEWGWDDPALQNLTAGDYTLSAVATDNVGARSGQSVTFTVSFTTDISETTVSQKESLAKIYSLGKNVIVHLKASHALANIYDINGRLIVNKQIVHGENQILINHAGVYLVKVITRNMVETQKIFIK
ncbi:glycosyl hydrolase [Carboxylicivirga sp. M1479]|uniref:glycosyl hydrolase n=1 Tax=Carboxylicivirga sp. M1479 TaxID=2594476 RepID=UPI001177740D|nr:glycosyl hydrolase [Carboxylicivirga sp. M1479]TRX71162.1 T9SS type A sorting domain-containing protein [Carboxylicivirga sp. M1479]